MIHISKRDCSDKGIKFLNNGVKFTPTWGVILLGLKRENYIRISCPQIQHTFIQEQHKETIRRKLNWIL